MTIDAGQQALTPGAKGDPSSEPFAHDARSDLSFRRAVRAIQLLVVSAGLLVWVPSGLDGSLVPNELEPTTTVALQVTSMVLFLVAGFWARGSCSRYERVLKPWETVSLAGLYVAVLIAPLRVSPIEEWLKVGGLAVMIISAAQVAAAASLSFDRLDRLLRSVHNAFVLTFALGLLLAAVSPVVRALATDYLLGNSTRSWYVFLSIHPVFALTLGVGVIRLSRGRGFMYRWGTVAYLLGVVIAIAFTRTRSFVVAVAILGLVMAVVALRRRRVAAAMLFGLAVIAWFVGPRVSEVLSVTRFDVVFLADAVDPTSGRSDATNGRAELIDVLLEEWGQHPILGSGITGAEEAVESANLLATSEHGIFIFVAAFGVLVLPIFGFAFAAAFRSIRPLVRRDLTVWDEQLAVCMLAVAVLSSILFFGSSVAVHDWLACLVAFLCLRRFGTAPRVTWPARGFALEPDVG